MLLNLVVIWQVVVIWKVVMEMTIIGDVGNWNCCLLWSLSLVVC